MTKQGTKQGTRLSIGASVPAKDQAALLSRFKAAGVKGWGELIRKMAAADEITIKGPGQNITVISAGGTNGG